MSKIMKRQGDLLFIKTSRSGGKGSLQKSKDILKSSVTGHSHTLTEGHVFINEPNFQNRGNFYVVIPVDGSEVVHPEHGPIGLDEGVWEVRRQREVSGYVYD